VLIPQLLLNQDSNLPIIYTELSVNNSSDLNLERDPENLVIGISQRKFCNGVPKWKVHWNDKSTTWEPKESLIFNGIANDIWLKFEETHKYRKRRNPTQQNKNKKKKKTVYSDGNDDNYHSQ